MQDPETQRMVNCYNPYQAHRNFLFSRNLSYYATGTFRGVGYRDIAQDVLAMIPFDLEAAKDKTRLLLTQQYRDGHVNHYFFPVEGYEPVTTVHSDDHLWTILTVWSLIAEEGKPDFLKEEVSYYDGGRGTVYEHLLKALDFSLSHLGKEGFPLMLRSDWNDALFRVCREGKGESIWTAMQLGVMLQKLEGLAERMEDTVTVKRCKEVYEVQKRLVNTKGWDGEWYRRAIMDSGEYVGKADSPEAKIWLNTQTWAVLSGMGDKAKVKTAMESVHRILNASNIFGPDSLRFGLANVSWLTGTAAWMYLAVSQYILGVRPVYEGLKVEPCLPSAWNRVKVHRSFRGGEYEILMERVGEGEEPGIQVDGIKIEGNVIPYEQFGEGGHMVLVRLA